MNLNFFEVLKRELSRNNFKVVPRQELLSFILFSIFSCMIVVIITFVGLIYFFDGNYSSIVGSLVALLSASSLAYGPRFYKKVQMSFKWPEDKYVYTITIDSLKSSRSSGIAVLLILLIFIALFVQQDNLFPMLCLWTIGTIIEARHIIFSINATLKELAYINDAQE